MTMCPSDPVETIFEQHETDVDESYYEGFGDETDDD